MARHYTPEERAAMVRAYCEEWLSLVEVGRRFGCDHSTVLAALHAVGLRARTRREQKQASLLRLRRAVAQNGRLPL